MTSFPEDVQVVLADGTRGRIRPVRGVPGDESELRALFEHLGPVARRQRFLAAVPHLKDADVRYLAHPDARMQLVLAFDVPLGPRGNLHTVGLARCGRTSPESREAEVAAMVEDDWQHRGIGVALLGALASWSRAAGIERWVADMLIDNRVMARALEEVAHKVRSAIQWPGVIRAEYEL